MALTLLSALFLADRPAARSAGAAPEPQTPDYAVQAQAIAKAFGDLGLTPEIRQADRIANADAYYAVNGDRTLQDPSRIETFKAYIVQNPQYIAQLIEGFEGLNRALRRFALGSDTAAIAEGLAQLPSEGSGAQQTLTSVNDSGVRLGCGNVFGALTLHFEARLAVADQAAASAEGNRLQGQLEQRAESMARAFYRALRNPQCLSGRAVGRRRFPEPRPGV